MKQESSWEEEGPASKDIRASKKVVRGGEREEMGGEAGPTDKLSARAGCGFHRALFPVSSFLLG